MTRQEVADALGISLRTYQNHEIGLSTPKASQLLILAGMGCDPTWAITGAGPAGPGMQECAPPRVPPLDPALLGLVVEAVARLYREQRVGLPAVELGRLAAAKYEELAQAVEGPEDWPGALKMMMIQLRRALRSAAAAGEQGGA